MAAGGTLYIDARLADPHNYIVRFNQDKTYIYQTSDDAVNEIKKWLDGAFPEPRFSHKEEKVDHA